MHGRGRPARVAARAPRDEPSGSERRGGNVRPVLRLRGLAPARPPADRATRLARRERRASRSTSRRCSTCSTSSASARRSSSPASRPTGTRPRSRRSSSRGHEVGCHGYEHRRAYRQTPDEFRRDVAAASMRSSASAASRRSATARRGSRSRATRVWAHDILRELGFRYDSSLFDSPRIPRRIQPIPHAPLPHRRGDGDALWEFPVAVWRAGRMIVPLGGGAYWRALPSVVLWQGLESLSRTATFPVLYFHPYEFADGAPPRDPARAREPSRAGPRDVATRLQERPQRDLIRPRLGEAAARFRLVPFRDILDRGRPMTSTRRYFDSHARSFDRLYAGRSILTHLRPGPVRGRELAVSVVARHSAPSVLDVGCGPGRVAEAVLDAGAATYVGIDLSPGMLALARRRLDAVRGSRAARGRTSSSSTSAQRSTSCSRWVSSTTSRSPRAPRRGCATAARRRSLPPSRAGIGSRHRFDTSTTSCCTGCPIFDYTAANAEALLVGAGFSNVAFPDRGHRGFLVTATP